MSRDRTTKEIIEDLLYHDRRALEDKEIGLKLVADAARKEKLPKVHVVLCPNLELHLWSIHRTKRGAEEALTVAKKRDHDANIDAWDLDA